jgi:hypothetical protein
LELDPKYDQAIYFRGMMKFALGDHRMAMKDFETVVKLDSKSMDNMHMLAVVKHGLVLFLFKLSFSLLFRVCYKKQSKITMPSLPLNQITYLGTKRR